MYIFRKIDGEAEEVYLDALRLTKALDFYYEIFLSCSESNSNDTEKLIPLLHAINEYSQNVGEKIKEIISEQTVTAEKYSNSR